MKNSFFLNIIKTFSEAELRDFDKFVNSPYFNTSPTVTNIFNAVKECYPHFDEKLLQKNIIFKIIHPEKRYNDVLMRKYISNLNKLAEKFIIINNYRFPEHSLLKGLLRKKLYRAFLQRLNKIEKNTLPDIIDDDHFVSGGLLKGEMLNYYNMEGKEFEYEKEKVNILEIDSLYFFYRLAQVNYRRQSFASENDYNVTDYLLLGIDIRKLYDKIESSDIKNKPVLKFLLSLPLLQQTRDENLYSDIKKFSFSYISKYSAKTLFIGFLYIHDFISYKIEQGCYEYYTERYRVYKFEERFHYTEETKDKISFAVLRNYFNAALKNNDIRWAEYLVEKYKEVFEQKGEVWLKNFLNAFILFHKKEYTQALASIAEFNINEQSAGDFAFTRDMRTLFLQIYFELGYINEAFYSIDSFSHYLKNNKKINQKNRTYFGNFVKYYKELLTMVSKENYSNLGKLKKNIAANKIIRKSWLLEKISEIESK
jgi:hypothetical protein